MKALVVLAAPPLPEGNAQGRCSVGLLRGLLAHGVEVTAVAPRRHFSPPGQIPPDLPVEEVEVPAVPRLRSRLARLRRPRGELASAAFFDRVRELAGAADVLHLEEIDTAWCNLGLRLPSLLHLHYLIRRDRSLGVPLRRGFPAAAEFAVAEWLAVRRHHRLVANSPLVAGALRAAAPGAEVTLAPLSLDPRGYPAAPLDGPPVAGVIGTASWVPTAAAMRRLLTRVWPLVRREVPEARLLVAGRRLERLRAVPPAGVELLGQVPSASEFLRSLSLLLYPIERGSGMKVKVLEALASGLPVVTTSAGAEGIEQGEGVLVETGDGELAGAAVRLLRDEAERRARGRAARETFLSQYTPEAATEPLVRLYEHIAR